MEELMVITESLRTKLEFKASLKIKSARFSVSRVTRKIPKVITYGTMLSALEQRMTYGNDANEEELKRWYIVENNTFLNLKRDIFKTIVFTRALKQASEAFYFDVIVFENRKVKGIAARSLQERMQRFR